MDIEKFKKNFEGTFEQDPMIQEVVKFLRTSTFVQVAQARRDGLFTAEMHKEAKRILDIEQLREADKWKM